MLRPIPQASLQDRLKSRGTSLFQPYLDSVANGNKPYLDSVENRIQNFSEINDQGFSK